MGGNAPPVSKVMQTPVEGRVISTMIAVVNDREGARLRSRWVCFLALGGDNCVRYLVHDRFALQTACELRGTYGMF